MNEEFIYIQRIPYEEPYHLHLRFAATNGRFGGSLDIYINASDLKDIGEALMNFPQEVPDSYSYMIGSSNPEDRSAFYFALHTYTIGGLGHSALQIEIDNNENRPHGATCRFSIEAEPSAIRCLGKLLLNFYELKHSCLVWTPDGTGNELIEGAPWIPYDLGWEGS